MITPISPADLFLHHGSLPVIDVRSPGEFRQGHIPGAVSIPLFTDAERAVIGTLYVQEGREQAILRGLDLALPATASYCKALQTEIGSSRSIVVHCWRGGLRSTLMSEVFSRAGAEVHLLTGGYKAYRHLVREELGRPADVIVLGGYTGSGKTDLLREIGRQGHQVIDLEALACHRGSAFGALGQPPQPTNEQFENDLHAAWSALDFSRPVWVEDESRMIGNVTLPEPVFDWISRGRLVQALVGFETRVDRLVREYAGFDPAGLAEALRRITVRLGGAHTQEALEALDRKDFHRVASIALAYYDKAYQHSIDRHSSRTVRTVTIDGNDLTADALRIVERAG